MHYGFNWRVEYHSWPCPAHDFAYLFALLGRIAMGWAILAGGLLLAILAMVETAKGKLCQMLIFIIQPSDADGKSWNSLIPSGMYALAISSHLSSISGHSGIRSSTSFIDSRNWCRSFLSISSKFLSSISQIRLNPMARTVQPVLAYLFAKVLINLRLFRIFTASFIIVYEKTAPTLTSQCGARKLKKEN